MRKHTAEVKAFLEVNPTATAYRVAKELNLHPRHTALVMKDLKDESNPTEVLTKKDVLIKFGVKTVTAKVTKMLEAEGYTKVKSTKFPFAVTYVK